MKKIVIAGGTGFLGRSFIEYFTKEYQAKVIVLSRKVKANSGSVHFVKWDGKILGEWTEQLEDADVLLNLAGRTVNCRYNKKNKSEILDSRVETTAILGEAIRLCAHPPKTWINMSTSTIYRDEYEKPNDEIDGKIGSGFSVNVAKEWEATFFEIPLTDTRKVAIRTAIALGEDGDVFKIYKKHVKMYISGKHGHGRQWISWIHEEDFYRAVIHLAVHEKCKGVYNLASPVAIKDRDFMSTFRNLMGYSWGLPIPAWMLTIGAFFLRTETELILKSRWVFPRRLLEDGFTFKFKSMQEGLDEILSRNDLVEM